MKKLMVLIILTGFVFLNFNITAFAWDPSGSWGIEGRTDATLVMSCKEDACSYTLQSAYGRYRASGFIKGDQIVVAYNYLTENNFGFILFEKRGDNRMYTTTYNPNGKVMGNTTVIRK
jgi:hypothetical protein